MQFLVTQQVFPISSRDPRDLPPLLRMLAGSTAGLTSVFLTYPLDYVHSRIAYQVKSARYRGVAHTIALTMQEAGIKGLYRQSSEDRQASRDELSRAEPSRSEPSRCEAASWLHSAARLPFCPSVSLSLTRALLVLLLSRRCPSSSPSFRRVRRDCSWHHPLRRHVVLHV